MDSPFKSINIIKITDTNIFDKAIELENSNNITELISKIGFCFKNLESDPFYNLIRKKIKKSEKAEEEHLYKKYNITEPLTGKEDRDDMEIIKKDYDNILLTGSSGIQTTCKEFENGNYAIRYYYSDAELVATNNLENSDHKDILVFIRENKKGNTNLEFAKFKMNVRGKLYFETVSFDLYFNVYQEDSRLVRLVNILEECLSEFKYDELLLNVKNKGYRKLLDRINNEKLSNNNYMYFGLSAIVVLVGVIYLFY